MLHDRDVRTVMSNLGVNVLGCLRIICAAHADD